MNLVVAFLLDQACLNGFFSLGRIASVANGIYFGCLDRLLGRAGWKNALVDLGLCHFVVDVFKIKALLGKRYDYVGMGSFAKNFF